MTDIATEPDFAAVERWGLNGTHWRHPNSDVSRHAEIGAGCYIGPNVIVGALCVIGPNTVIGDRGFGYEDDGTYRPHPWGVVVMPGCRIGANTCIDAGRWRTTHIGGACRIDNGCHVGHNVKIGKRSMLVAHSMIGGSCEIGADVMISSAKLCDHVKVGDGAHIGLGAVVMDDVPAGEVWVGVPARKLR